MSVRFLLAGVIISAGVASASPRDFERPVRDPGPSAPAPAGAAAAVDRGQPFSQGSMNLGLVLGFSASQGTAFALGGAFGYFVLSGLEPGLELEVTFGSDRPTVTSLLPYLRWVIWRSYTLSPYVKAQGGRWFISDQDDLSAIGGGGGLVFFLTRNAGLQLEGMVYRLFPEEVCGDSCTHTAIGFSLGFYFGNPPPVPRSRPAPPPPVPGDEPPHEAAPRDEPVPWGE